MSERAETVSVNGIDLRYRTQGQGEPLLLVHGAGGAGGDFVHCLDLPDLAQHHSLIIPDLRGHGGSTNPSAPLSHRACADDVLRLLDLLGVARCKAIGLSMGGNVLLHAATAQPERIAAMVVVSATPYFPEPARRIMRTISEDTRSPEAWAEMRGRHLHGDDQIRALWSWMRSLADSHDDVCFTPALLSSIRARTLIVYGDRDPLYPVDLGVELYRAIPRSALWVVPEGGHLPVFQGQRAAFERQARSLLGAELPPA